MKKIILAAICFGLCLSTACTPVEKLSSQMKSNISEIAEGFSEPNDESEKYESENSISLGITELDTFNPLRTKSNTIREAMQLVYEPLFEADENGRVNPILASEYNVSADGLTYIIKMKSDVLWHDGEAIDAYDAVYTLKQIFEEETPYTESLKEISGYTAVSSGELKITLKKPVSDFVLLLNFPIIKSGTGISDEKEYKPIGTGAFAYVGKISEDKYELTAFENYHGGRAKIDKVYLREAPDGEKYMSLFAVSETDVISGMSADLTTYTPKGESRLHEIVSNRLTYIGFNTESSVLSGADTRRGIGALTDKADIVSSVLYSRAEGVNIPINPKSHLYYDTEVNLGGSYEKAMGLFGNDGWGEDRDGYLRRKKGNSSEKFTLSITVNKDDAVNAEIARKIKAQCEKCGISVSVEEFSAEVYAQKIASRDFDMYIGECDIGANGDLSALLKTGENPFGYSSENADMLTAQAGMTQNEDTLEEIYKGIGETAEQDAPFIPLYFAKDIAADTGRISEGISPTAERIYRNSHLWTIR